MPKFLLNMALGAVASEARRDPASFDGTGVCERQRSFCCCCVRLGHAMIPPHAMPCHPMPCRAGPGRAGPGRAVPCRAAPCHAMPSRPIPSHAMPSHAMPCHAMPSHPIPSHPIRLPHQLRPQVESRAGFEIDLLQPVKASTALPP